MYIRFFCCNENDVDTQMYGVMREVVGAAFHAIGCMKAAAGRCAAWACGMRIHVWGIARTVMGAQTLWMNSFYEAIDADLSALSILEERPVAVEFRAMVWLRKIFRGNEYIDQALISEVEAALALAPDAASGWDCRVALALAHHMAGKQIDDRGKYDQAI